VQGTFTATLGDVCQNSYPPSGGTVSGQVQISFEGDAAGGLYVLASDHLPLGDGPIIFDCPFGAYLVDQDGMDLSLDPATGELTYAGWCSHFYMCSDWGAAITLNGKFRCVPGQTVCWKGSIVSCDAQGTITASAPCGLPCGPL
jgi:hypothetical protein